MYRPPDVENLADFIQYYRSSFIGYDEHRIGEYLPIFIHGPDGGGERVRITDSNGDLRTVPFERIMEQAQFGCPQYGTAELDASVFFVSRRSARSQYRGHRSSLVRYTMLGAGDIQPPGIMDSWPYAKALFKPTYRPFDRAYMDLMRGERFGCALTPYFSLAHVLGYKVPCLHYKTKLVGFATSPTSVALDGDSDYLLVTESFPNIQVN